MRDKSNLRLSDELLGLGLALIDKATRAQGLTATILHRDGLLIAFLALVPLRMRNLARLRIGRNMIDVSGTWSIALDARETDPHADRTRLSNPIPARAPFLVFYVFWCRNRLSASNRLVPAYTVQSIANTQP